ncbi:MAG: DUF418 domain-containing protein, partial [Anaerolineae bacterium]
MTTPTARPVQPRERIQFVDILRGFALFGVLVFNISGFAGEQGGYQIYTSMIARAVVMLRDFFIQAKFYSMFSFLFGWGMAIQMLRAQARGTKFLPVFLRRLVVLLVIGFFHAILFWTGDILTLYALFGFVLLLFRKRSERFLLVASGLTLLLAIFLRWPGQSLDVFRNWYAQ